MRRPISDREREIFLNYKNIFIIIFVYIAHLSLLSFCIMQQNLLFHFQIRLIRFTFLHT